LPDQREIGRTIQRVEGNAIGSAISKEITRIIFVDPERYGDLSVQEKYAVARLIGKLNKAIAVGNGDAVLLMGPGRWGTCTPAMGVPVTFSEINHVTVIA
ncbi:MAG TPA: hypothetical protein VLR45_10605, partial [Desulfoprunum sp.]|nr:hypothetical protein [Desulfoprunum sp.]